MAMNLPRRAASHEVSEIVFHMLSQVMQEARISCLDGISAVRDVEGPGMQDLSEMKRSGFIVG